MDEDREYFVLKQAAEARRDRAARRRRRALRWVRRWNLSAMVGTLIALKVYELRRQR